MGSLQVVVVASPQGGGLRTTEVVFDAGKTVWGLSPDGPKHAAKRSYDSLDDAVVENSRATTSSWMVTVEDQAAAIALLGKTPPST